MWFEISIIAMILVDMEGDRVGRKRSEAWHGQLAEPHLNSDKLCHTLEVHK